MLPVKRAERKGSHSYKDSIPSPGYCSDCGCFARQYSRELRRSEASDYARVKRTSTTKSRRPISFDILNHFNFLTCIHVVNNILLLEYSIVVCLAVEMSKERALALVLTAGFVQII